MSVSPGTGPLSTLAAKYLVLVYFTHFPLTQIARTDIFAHPGKEEHNLLNYILPGRTIQLDPPLDFLHTSDMKIRLFPPYKEGP